MRPNQELCLLSLDGGGVRGLSTLLILKRIMEAINPEDPPKPCDYFHMICGTSTGGLIALMLGRMRLTVDECIAAYGKMSPDIFTKLHHRIKLRNGETQGRFDHEALEEGVKGVLREHGFRADELLKDNLAMGSCKTFVIATSQHTGQPVVFSSYYNKRRGTDMLHVTKIWEAARATSAATTFFEPITIGDETFVDGATGANNPIQYLWAEAGDVLSDHRGRLEDEIRCIVSIGTGIPSLKPFGPGLKQVAKALQAVATDTEEVAETFRKHHTELFGSNKAFRFNVLRGLENIGLEEAEKWGELKAKTRAYVQMEDVHIRIKACAANLQEREWLKTLRRKLLNLIRPAITTLNDDETHPTMKELQWLAHTKAYETWKKSSLGIIWYQSPNNCSNDHRKGVAAAVAFHTSKRYKSFAGLQLGVGDMMARALYFQCDRRQAGDDYDPDAPDYVSPGDILWSLICQCLIMECEAISVVNRRILELDEYSRAALHDAIAGRRTQPLAFLFNVLLQALQVVNLQVMLGIDNIHKLEDSTAGAFVNALRVFVEEQLPQANRKLPTLISGSASGMFAEHLDGVLTVDDETEREECIQSLYFPEWNARRDQIADAEKGTNDWIWSNDQYMSWDRASTAVLWVEGKPGSGKSVLAKSLQQKLARSITQAGTNLSASGGSRNSRSAVVRSKMSGAPLVVDWFYSTRLGEVGMAHLSLLRSVLYQLLEQDKGFFQFVASSYRKKPVAANEQQEEWGAAEINRVLGDISKSGTSVVCIIDAMDEAKEIASGPTKEVEASRPTTILKMLWDLVSKVKNSKLKFIVLSRPDPLIEVEFNRIRRTFPETYKIVLEHENLGDIELLIGKGLKTLREAIRTYDSDSDDDFTPRERSRKYKGLDSARAAFSKSERKALENIRSYVLNHAEGVILWVTLVLGELEDFAYNGMLSLPELEKRVKALPRQLDALYEHVVKDLQESSTKSDITHARTTLMLISGLASLGRPLRVREMWEALAIPDEVEEALRSATDPILCNRTRIKSWAAFRRHLRRRCGPFIEVVSVTTQGDIGPDDILQFMHRTVKDFMHNPERSGPLHFSEKMAAAQVKAMARKYLQIGFPELEPRYGPRLSKWKATPWGEHVSDYVGYLEDKILLQFSLSVLPKHCPEVPAKLGFLSQAHQLIVSFPRSFRVSGHSLSQHLIEGQFPEEIRKFYPELNTKSQSSRRSDSDTIAVGECFYYACENGLVVATRNLLAICKEASRDVGRLVYAMKNGALLAAIQHDFVPEVRALTQASRHQSVLLATKGGWPIGTDKGKNGLDPFIQLAARSGSVDIVGYLFDHTDRYYARKSAIREFAVTRTRLHESLASPNTEDYRASSVSSFDLGQLGLVDKPKQKSLAQPKKHMYRGRQGKNRERQEYAKLRNTCIQFAQSVHDANRADERSAKNHKMDDVRESIGLVINTNGNLEIETNPYPVIDQRDLGRTGTDLSLHESGMQEEAFARFLDHHIMSSPHERSRLRSSRPRPRSRSCSRSYSPVNLGSNFEQGSSSPFQPQEPTVPRYQERYTRQVELEPTIRDPYIDENDPYLPHGSQDADTRWLAPRDLFSVPRSYRDPYERQQWPEMQTSGLYFDYYDIHVPNSRREAGAELSPPQDRYGRQEEPNLPDSGSDYDGYNGYAVNTGKEADMEPRRERRLGKKHRRKPIEYDHIRDASRAWKTSSPSESAFHSLPSRSAKSRSHISRPSDSGSSARGFLKRIFCSHGRGE